jgi:hypothetical protein
LKIDLTDLMQQSDGFCHKHKKDVEKSNFFRELSFVVPRTEVKYIGEMNVSSDIHLMGYYCPVLSVRAGKTIFYLRCGYYVEDGVNNYIWWADNLGAYDGVLKIKP